MSMVWIKELHENDNVFWPLLVVNATKGVTDAGKRYMNLTFQDRTGTIEAKKWDCSEEDMELLVVGNIVFIEGVVNLYKNQLQLRVNSIRKEENVDLSLYKLVSPIPLEELKAKLDYFMHSFKDKDVELITKTVIEHFYDKYITYPGAVRIHHEFGSGILHHSVKMAEMAEYVAKCYPQVDRDILVAGALLHDIGKTIEYDYLVAPSVTTEGKLIGHIPVMYAEFKKIVDNLNIKSEVPLLLEHMILSHHGKLEFGSPVMPATREALLLSEIDMMDSRMMVLDKALADVKPGEFTPRLWPMDDTVFYKPKER